MCGIGKTFLNFDAGVIIDPDSIECGNLGTGTIDEFKVTIAFKQFQLVDYINSTPGLLDGDTEASCLASSIFCCC